MNHPINAFHHLGIISRDMAATVATYENLGFVFTPLSLPRIPLTLGGTPEQLGVANRCAIFRDNYLEMLGVVDAARWSAISTDQRGPYDIDVPLRRYAGLHVMHFATDDIEAVHSRLSANGAQPTAIRPFRRLVDTPDGPQMMRAKTLSFPSGTHPEALLQIAQHETPELVLQPRFMQHPNGATSISEAIVCVCDPDAVVSKYAAYTGSPVRRSGSLRVLDLGESRVIVLHPEHIEEVAPGNRVPTLPFMAGFTVKADLTVATDFLKRRAIPFRAHGERLLVSADVACGSVILFEETGANRQSDNA